MGSPQSRRRRGELKIDAFPVGERTWRLDWFGRVGYPERGHRSAQPSVAVWLSPLLSDAWTRNPGVLLDGQLATRFSARTMRFVSIGTLVILRVGSLWQNQLLVGRPPYEVETFERLRIGPKTVGSVKAGADLEEGGFLLPMKEHPWHMGSTQSQCVKVALDDGRWLIVPCLELMRFYFGSSSVMLSRLFLPDFSAKSLFEDWQIDPTTRAARLSLAAGVPRSSVDDVARIAGDPVALDAARLVSRSCVQSTVSDASGEVHPRCTFPFQGVTDLQARGIWLSRHGVARRTFLAFELLSCSHAFPYQRLTYTLSSDESPESARAVSQAQDDRINRVVVDAKGTGRRLLEKDAGRALVRRMLPMVRSVKFPDLLRKTAFAAEPSRKQLGVRVAAVVASPDGHAVGEQVSTSKLRSLEIVERATRSGPTKLPGFARQLVRALDRFNGAAFVLTSSDEDAWTVAAPVEQSGRPAFDSATALLIDGRPRRVFAAELRREDEHCLLCAVEAAPPIAFLINWSPVFEHLDELLSMALDGFAAASNAYAHAPERRREFGFSNEALNEHLGSPRLMPTECVDDARRLLYIMNTGVMLGPT